MKELIIRYFYSAIQKTIELVHRYNKNCPSIYMFHQVNDDKSEWLDNSVCITKKGFAEFIDRLSDQGHYFSSICDLQHEPDGKAVYITFDDAFSDAIENAIPYLKEKNIPFCVFVTEFYIETTNFLSAEQLQILSEEPLCTIGFHTKNHCMMRRIKEQEMKDELDCSDLEKKVGRIRYFAFPYGSLYACSRQSINMVKELGYDLCFSTIAVPCGEWWLRKCRHFLPRININEQNYKNIRLKS